MAIEMIKGHRDTDYSLEDGEWDGYDRIEIEATPMDPFWHDCRAPIWVEVPPDKLGAVKQALESE